MYGCDEALGPPIPYWVDAIERAFSDYKTMSIWVLISGYTDSRYPDAKVFNVRDGLILLYYMSALLMAFIFKHMAELFGGDTTTPHYSTATISQLNYLL